jgi:hypothetical protein
MGHFHQDHDRRQRFIDCYVASFLAAEASRALQRAEVEHTTLAEQHQPLENAFILAMGAWKQAQQLGILDQVE